MDKNFKHSNLILVFGVIMFLLLVCGVYYFNEYQKEAIKRSAKVVVAREETSNYSMFIDSLAETVGKINLKRKAYSK
jgi:hypothetical protein